MTTRTITDSVLYEPPLLRVDERIGSAVRKVLDADLPALPVVSATDTYAGVFGEREFMNALFPGYLGQLRGAHFLRRSIDEVLERRENALDEPVSAYMNREHVDVGADYSDVEVAEVFLHHRVLVVPIVVDRRVRGLITRKRFFHAIASQALEGWGGAPS